jgi:ligand-binding sensor domain-containing protein
MDLLHRESGLFNFFPMMRISASSKILVIILFFGCSLLNARYNERQFLHLTKPLSQNTGQCILQDHLGFLWIGTANGLNRFDGINVHSYEYDPKDTTSLSNNNIRKIAEDQTGDLWIATEFGLNRYSRDKDKFTRYYPRRCEQYIQ